MSFSPIKAANDDANDDASSIKMMTIEHNITSFANSKEGKMNIEMNTNTIANTAMNAASAASKKAKEYGEKINAATDGQAGKYAEMAKDALADSKAVKTLKTNKKARLLTLFCAVCLVLIFAISASGNSSKYEVEREKAEKLALSYAALEVLSGKMDNVIIRPKYGTELVWSEAENCAYLVQITYDKGANAGNHFYLVAFKNGDSLGMEKLSYAMSEEELGELAKTCIKRAIAREEMENNM